MRPPPAHSGFGRQLRSPSPAANSGCLVLGGTTGEGMRHCRTHTGLHTWRTLRGMLPMVVSPGGAWWHDPPPTWRGMQCIKRRGRLLTTAPQGDGVASGRCTRARGSGHSAARAARQRAREGERLRVRPARRPGCRRLVPAPWLSFPSCVLSSSLFFLSGVAAPVVYTFAFFFGRGWPLAPAVVVGTREY